MALPGKAIGFAMAALLGPMAQAGAPALVSGWRIDEQPIVHILDRRVTIEARHCRMSRTIPGDKPTFVDLAARRGDSMMITLRNEGWHIAPGAHHALRVADIGTPLRIAIGGDPGNRFTALVAELPPAVLQRIAGAAAMFVETESGRRMRVPLDGAADALAAVRRCVSDGHRSLPERDVEPRGRRR